MHLHENHNKPQSHTITYTQQKQSCYVNKVFGYYNYVTILIMRMQGWKKS